MFEKWGLPLAIRTDNGEPFGVPTRDVIPILSLWLAAWGINHILNRPRHPQDNAKVERNQGTSSRWAEIGILQTASELQERLNEIVLIQRNCYPVKKIGNVPRSEVFRQLEEKTRPFCQATFDEKKAYNLLEKASFPRKVNNNGTISIYHGNLQVGAQHKGKIVILKFQAHDVSWNAFSQENEFIKNFPDPRFSKENLFNLTVFQRT